MNDFPRVNQNPAVMGDKPCIRGPRVTVGAIVGRPAPGNRSSRFWPTIPNLEREDVLEALRYAAWGP